MYIKAYEDNDCFLISRHLTEKNAMSELENIFRSILLQSGCHED